MAKFPLPHSLRRLFVNRQVLIGFTLTSFILLLAIAGPWFSPYLPQDLTGVRYGPSQCWRPARLRLSGT